MARDCTDCHQEEQIGPDLDPVTTIDLEEDLWSQLPDELILRIVAWLPLPDICKMRAVCKKWTSCLSHSSFAGLHSLTPSDAANLLMFANTNSHELSTFCPSVKKWYRIPLPFIPSSMKQCVAANGSLLCMINASQSHECVLHVCNPMSKTLKKLPPMLNISEPFIVAMTVDSQARAYKIVVVGNSSTSNAADYRNRTTEIYDSRTGFWKTSGSVPKEVLIYSGLGTVFCRGSLYCPIEWPHGLLAFSLDREEWSIERAPLPSCLMHPHLMDCNGRLVMAGEVSKRGVRSICVWMLDSTLNEWVEVETMPEHLYKKFRTLSYLSFRCIGKGHLVLLTTNDSLKRLIFDLSKRLWYWLPGSPPLELAFYPRFDVLV